MIIDGEERRREIVDCLSNRNTPVNGTELSRMFGVSRQVIVQDIALLRAGNKNILSTNKGYVLYQPRKKAAGCSSVIMVRHTQEQTIEEMLAIVDYGGRMLDVFVDHDLYGQIRADLIINDREDAEEFCERMKNSHSKPLKELTGACHYHTITAPSEKAMQMILQELTEKGILL